LLVALLVIIFKVHALDLFFLRQTPLDQLPFVPLSLELILEGSYEGIVSISLLVSLESHDKLGLSEVQLVLPEVVGHTNHELDILGFEGLEPLLDGDCDPMGSSGVEG
jgi:hypothetical protein